MKTFRSEYGAIDRLVHRLAFRGVHLQIAVSDIEDALFSNALRAIHIERPVFITSLARSGTTTLLQILCDTWSFAAHSYADMPFVLCPLLWHQLTKAFRRSDGARERAHGDGVLVNFDSPEAFEEIVWRAFWPKMYSGTRIRTWEAGLPDEDFVEFFVNHMRKIILLRRQSPQTPRYVSKNNANIARLRLIGTLFPDSTVVIPFRNPRDHAVSLLRQHANFSILQEHDTFARQYMQYVGHLEFGNLLTPIDFDGWLASHPNLDPRELPFWLQYWCAAFEYVLREPAPNLALLDYDGMCADPAASLRALASCLQCDGDPLTSIPTDRIRAARTYNDVHLDESSALGSRAMSTYARLRSLAINNY
jgi:class 3 adenylate cyclase